MKLGRILQPVQEKFLTFRGKQVFLEFGSIGKDIGFAANVENGIENSR